LKDLFTPVTMLEIAGLWRLCAGGSKDK